MHTTTDSVDRTVPAVGLGAFLLSATYLAVPLMPMTTPGWFENGSLSFELVKGLPAAFVALVVAGIAGLIAWRQVQIARGKLNLDLFDQRLAIFEATWSFLSKVVNGGELDLRDGGEFTNLLPKAQFLFGLEIREYMSEASSRRGDLWVIQEEWKADRSPKEQKQIDQRRELMNWFGEQASSGCRAKFSPYLDFSQWR